MTANDRSGRLELAFLSRQRPDNVPPRKPRTPRKRAHLHPGVRLLEPDSEHRSWRARYVDITGKTRTLTLERVDSKTAETRQAWAVKLSEQLQRTRSDARAGVLRVGEDIPLADAVERFFAAHPTLAPATAADYRVALERCVRGRERLTTHGVIPGVVTAWRTELVTARKRVAERGGRKGSKVNGARVTPATANKHLSSLARRLDWMRVAGLIRLTRDDIRDALRKERVLVQRKPFLRVEQIAQLMSACARHDAASTRYQPITPVVRALLLTGARISELLALEWRDVLDDRLKIRAEVSKTRQEREVELHVSPTLLDGLTRGAPNDRVWRYTRKEVEAAAVRMAEYAPAWTPHTLRRTCGTFLTCAPSIYGAASAYMSARRLGHSVQIAERFYTGAVRVSPEARTLEAAMQLSAAETASATGDAAL